MMIFQLYKLMLFGPGIRYVPDFVWRSKFFWIGVMVMIVGILLYHNMFRRKNGNQRRAFNRPIENGPWKTAKVLYVSDGRSGHVVFQNKETKFAMYYEFGIGNCVSSIDIPSIEHWEQQTKLPLDHRDEVLHFIGQQVVYDQTTNGRGYYKIERNWLNIYM